MVTGNNVRLVDWRDNPVPNQWDNSIQCHGRTRDPDQRDRGRDLDHRFEWNLGQQYYSRKSQGPETFGWGYSVPTVWDNVPNSPEPNQGGTRGLPWFRLLWLQPLEHQDLCWTCTDQAWDRELKLFLSLFGSKVLLNFVYRKLIFSFSELE